MARRVLVSAVLSFLVAAACPVVRPLAADDLVGHWSFDRFDTEETSEEADHRSAAEVRGATAVEGIAGGALRFDGVDDYVGLGDLGEHESVTVAFWMKPERVEKKDEWQGLVSSDGWEEGVLHIPVRDRVVDVYLHLGDKGRGHVSSPPLSNGQWYHVAVVADAAGQSLSLILNGFEVDQAHIPGLSTKIKLIGQVVGREFDGQRPGRYFAGDIDDVRIYRRALAEAEIKTLCPDAPSLTRRDPRNIRLGRRIPDEGYCDQPYIVIAADGTWICTLTTGPGVEGDAAQHVVCTTSKDQGKTWSPLVEIEPSDGPEASWIVPVIVPGGRIYGFYTYNGDDVRTLNGKNIRADVIGWYAYKYSDDNGKTWSERYRLPMRQTACDRGNDFHGQVRIFWGIDKPNVVGDRVYFAFTKLGKFMLEMGEGWFYASDNLLTERDPAKLHWELLPEGEHGLRADEFGSVQEEHNMVPLSDGSLYCVYRTTMGYPCHAYSVDGGQNWTKPEPMTYTPGGRTIRTPRACPMVWRTAGGKFLFWYHNNPGAKEIWRGRNPVWLTGGVEKEGRIHWSQPEILLYDPNPRLGMSYPDLIEQDGRYWVAETQKTIARVHQLDPALVEGLWNQGQVRAVARNGLILESASASSPGEARLPGRLDFGELSGLSLDLWLRLDDWAAGQTILDSRTPEGAGLLLETAENGSVRLALSDGQAKAAWQCDPGLLEPKKLHHLVAIVDAGPQIITFVVDGVLGDGGDARAVGWTRYSDPLGDVSGTGTLRIAPSLQGELKSLRVYDRYLRTSEAVAGYHAGPK